MARQKYYDFTKIFGEEIERLLVQLKGLITSKKITDNLPDNAKKEIKMINDKIADIDIEDIDIDVIDGGDYSSDENLIS